MHDYIARNGVSEQTRWLRQQPQSMRHIPFDFELDEKYRRDVRREGILALVVIGIVAALWLLV